MVLRKSSSRTSAPRLRLRLRKFVHKPPGRPYKLEHRKSAKASLVGVEPHSLIRTSAYCTSDRFRLPVCSSGLRNDRQQNRICIIECHVALTGIAANRILVEQLASILFEDARKLLFHLGPHPTHDRHCETLGPTVCHEPK